MTPKRVKGYTSSDLIHERRNEVAAWNDDERVVRVVELRRGEVIVDVEALKSAVDRYTAAWERAYATRTDAAADAVTECGWNLRAALRKVGKR